MDEPLGCLLWLVWLPHELWKLMSGESRLGTSEMDRDVGRFWETFGIIATILVLLGGAAWWWFVGF